MGRACEAQGREAACASRQHSTAAPTNCSAALLAKAMGCHSCTGPSWHVVYLVRCWLLHAYVTACMLGPYLAVWIACPALLCMLEHSYAPTPGAGTQVGLRSGWACMGGAVLQSPSPGSGSWFICKMCSIPRLSGVVLVLCFRSTSVGRVVIVL